MFKVLQYSKKLEEAGLTREQAEAHLEILTAVIEEDMATKQDLRKLEDQMEKLEYRLTIKMGTMLTVAVAAIAALVKLF